MQKTETRPCFLTLLEGGKERKKKKERHKELGEEHRRTHKDQEAEKTLNTQIQERTL